MEKGLAEWTGVGKPGEWCDWTFPRLRVVAWGGVSRTWGRAGRPGHST